MPSEHQLSSFNTPSQYINKYKPPPTPGSGAAKRVALLCTKLQHVAPSFLFSSYILFQKGNLVTRNLLGGLFVCLAGASRRKTLLFFSPFSLLQRRDRWFSH